MNETQIDKRLLLGKIDSHRTQMRRDLESFRRQLAPASLLVAWSKRWVPLSRSIDVLTRTLGIDEKGRWGKWARFASLAALALPLIRFVARRGR